MACILFLIETIYRNQFRCNYLKYKTFFQNPFLNVWNLDEILKI